MLSLHTPYDIQIELSQYIRQARKRKKLSVKALEEKSGVPNSTIRKFESTGEISLRQFLLLYAAVDNLATVRALTTIEDTPKSIDEVLMPNVKS